VIFGITFEFHITEETVLLKSKEMKKLICTSILAILVASVTTVRAQDYPEEYLGLPGDNLNLYAVMKLFQESETLEAFERSLNDENSRINNLDLNGDNMVDYLTVADYVDGNVHTIVLRSVLDRNEYQDVAVFTVEKFRDGSVQIQLIGDEDLYGRNYIVEPIYAETPNPGYRGRQVSRSNVAVVTTTYYEVASWPMIMFIYSPRYVVWRSSWYWGYYPVYWRPWRPFYWHYYYGYHSHWYPVYYSHYRHWDRPRYHRYNSFYYGSVRAHSVKVERRISEGNYRQTYSRPDTRKDGEALYVSTHGTRSSNDRSTAVSGSNRRDAAPTGSRSSSQYSGQGSDVRRSGSSSQGRSEARPAGTVNSRTSTGQSGDITRRSTSTTTKSTPAASSRTNVSTSSSREVTTKRTQPAAQRSQSSAQRSQTTATRTQSTVQRSQSSTGRSQSTVQRSQSSTGRSQSTVQRTQSSANRSQSTAGRSQSTVQKSSPASSRQSAPAARTQSRSSVKSSTAAPSRSSSKSSGSKSSNSKSSSKSSKSSDNDSRSSRRK